jgi:hypothetical protein
MLAGKLKVTTSRCSRLTRSVIAATAIALAMLGLGASTAGAQEPIVGLWEITESCNGSVCDHIFSGWTSDGLEVDSDISPALVVPICYGTWIKLKARTYALTHGYFDYDGTTGLWNGNSGYFDYVVTVSKDGSTFTGVANQIDQVPGPNPFAGGGTPYTGTLTLSATKIEVDKSLLPAGAIP